MTGRELIILVLVGISHFGHRVGFNPLLATTPTTVNAFLWDITRNPWPLNSAEQYSRPQMNTLMHLIRRAPQLQKHWNWTRAGR